MSQSVVLIVVPRDRFSMFPACLDAIFANTHLPFRVIVVVGQADSGTVKYLSRMQVERRNMQLVLTDHLLTQAQARNLGLREAHERWCVILENDTLVHANWLAPLVQCAEEEGAAVVAPLIHWYRGIHAAGCLFEKRYEDGQNALRHRILYSDIRRKRIDYPESHCILIDRQRCDDVDPFDEVEPFDVDFGLLLQKKRLVAFFEPSSVTTYSAPPSWEIRDIPLFKFRWDPAMWQTRNNRFVQKWRVKYDASSKRASYVRQQLKLGLARWHANTITVGMSNVGVSSLNRLFSLAWRVLHPTQTTY